MSDVPAWEMALAVKSADVRIIGERLPRPAHGRGVCFVERLPI